MNEVLYDGKHYQAVDIGAGGRGGGILDKNRGFILMSTFGTPHDILIRVAKFLDTEKRREERQSFWRRLLRRLLGR